MGASGVEPVGDMDLELLPESVVRGPSRWTGQPDATMDPACRTTAGRLRTVNASVSGYGLGGPADFQATRPAPTPVSSPAPDPGRSPQSTLVGAVALDLLPEHPRGHFLHTGADRRGAFPWNFRRFGDGSTPFAGTYRNGAVVFTRFLLVGGASQNQQWRARIGTAAVPEMLNGAIGASRCRSAVTPFSDATFSVC